MNKPLFRGINPQTNEFVTGDLIHSKDGTVYIVTSAMIDHCSSNIYRTKIIPETIGQLTPFTDMKGNEIWTGDILDRKIKVGNELSGWVVELGKNGWILRDKDGRWFDLIDFVDRITITGNIHQP